LPASGAGACEHGVAVDAGGAVLAGVGQALVDLLVAEGAGEAGLAVAAEGVDLVCAVVGSGGVAWARGTFIGVDAAISSTEASNTRASIRSQ